MKRKSYIYIYDEIIRNRDDKGRILTYSVIKKLPNGKNYNFKFNTLKKARHFAIIGLKDIKTGKIDYLSD